MGVEGTHARARSMPKRGLSLRASTLRNSSVGSARVGVHIEAATPLIQINWLDVLASTGSSIRMHCPIPGPFSDRGNLFCARHTERLCALHLCQQNLRVELLFLAERSVQTRHYRLLNLRSTKSFCGRRQFRNVKSARVPAPFLKMQSKQSSAGFCIRQIHKENLVEPALTQHLRRQHSNVVRGCRQEHATLSVLHPSQQGGEQSLGESCICVSAGSCRRERLLNLVNPEHHGS